MDGERTYLRVRRRRNAVVALKIHLDGILCGDDGSPASEPTLLNNECAVDRRGPPSDQLFEFSNHRRPSKRAKKAIWRRISYTDNEELLLASNAPHDGRRKREFTVVEAILQDGDDDDGDYDSFNHRKRRRLTLVPSSVDGSMGLHSRRSSSNDRLASGLDTTRKKHARNAYLILPPNERTIDDSLREVFAGKRLASEHYEMCRTDPRFAGSRARWIRYRNADHGNILHACALWNDAGVATQLVIGDQSPDSTGQALVHDRDGEGRTPLQVAELCGHDAIVELLRDETGESDDESYVFDLYCLDGDGASEHESGEGQALDDPDDTATPSLDCELDGGVGYWDENGQLVLSLLPPRTMSEVSVADEDELEDPNNEEWSGNDYPDEDEGEGLPRGGGGGGGDDDDDDDPYGTMYDRTRRRWLTGGANDEEGDFDAAYGIYGQGEDGDFEFEEASEGSS